MSKEIALSQGNKKEKYVRKSKIRKNPVFGH